MFGYERSVNALKLNPYQTGNSCVVNNLSKSVSDVIPEFSSIYKSNLEYFISGKFMDISDSILNCLDNKICYQNNFAGNGKFDCLKTFDNAIKAPFLVDLQASSTLSKKVLIYDIFINDFQYSNISKPNILFLSMNSNESWSAEKFDFYNLYLLNLALKDYAY
jgi:hypothetical protein